MRLNQPNGHVGENCPLKSQMLDRFGLRASPFGISHTVRIGVILSDQGVFRRQRQIALRPTDVAHGVLVLLQPVRNILKDKFGSERYVAASREIKVMDRYNREGHARIIRRRLEREFFRVLGSLQLTNWQRQLVGKVWLLG